MAAVEAKTQEILEGDLFPYDEPEFNWMSTGQTADKLLHFLNCRENTASLNQHNVVDWAQRVFDRHHLSMVSSTNIPFPDFVASGVTSSHADLNEPLKEIVDTLAQETVFGGRGFLKNAVVQNDVKKVRFYIKHWMEIHDDDDERKRIFQEPLQYTGFGQSEKSILDLAAKHGHLEMIQMIVDDFPISYEIVVDKVSKMNTKESSLTVEDAIIASRDRDDEKKEEERVARPLLLRTPSRRRDKFWRSNVVRDENAFQACQWLDEFKKRVEQLVANQCTHVDYRTFLEQPNFMVECGDPATRKTNKQQADECVELVLGAYLRDFHDALVETNAVNLRSYLKSFDSARMGLSREIYGAVWRSLVIKAHTKWNNTLQELDRMLASGKAKRQAQRKKFAQPIANPVDAYYNIVKTQNSFTKFVYHFGLETGGHVYVSGAKSFPRAVQKAAKNIFTQDMDDYRNHKKRTAELNMHHLSIWNTWDWVRGCINYSSLAEVKEACRVLTTKTDDITILMWSVGIESTHADSTLANLRGKENEKRWQDIKVYFTLKPPNDLDDSDTSWADGQLLVELQLSLTDFVVARKQLGGHEVYSMFRYAEEVKKAVDNVGEKRMQGGVGQHRCWGCR